jgi:hypothetical protein
MKSIELRIAEELGVRAAQVHAAIELLDGARCRKLDRDSLPMSAKL